MRRVYLHVKRLFKRDWFIILIVSSISFVYGIGLVIVMTIISMAFFKDPVDIDAILENFTDEELEMIQAEYLDENVTDEEYLTTMAKYQSYMSPKKIDYLTTRIGAESTNESYILIYEVKRKIESVSENSLKESILANINKSCVLTQRIVRSNKNMIFRYTYRNTENSFDIVISNDELKA